MSGPDRSWFVSTIVLKQDARMPHAQNPEYNIALVTHVCPVVWRGLSG